MIVPVPKPPDVETVIVSTYGEPVCDVGERVEVSGGAIVVNVKVVSVEIAT